MKSVVLIRSNPVSPDPPVEKVASTLLCNGYNVTILAWDRNNKYREHKSELNIHGYAVPIITFGIPAQFGGGFKSLKQLAEFQFKIARWLNKNHKKYDVVHAFDFDTGFIAKRYVKKFQKKFIYHILDFYVDSHNLNGSIIGKTIKEMEFKTINMADHTFICTEKRKEQIKGSHPKKLSVIHNTPQIIPGNDRKLEVVGDDAKCKIVYVGILAEGRFVKEVAEFVAKDQRFELHIGGFGYLEREIIQYSKKYPNIFFYGKLPYSETLSLESQCDIMTAIYNPNVPNHHFAAPNKFYESLMLGKPLIMIKGTGCDEIVKSEKIGCVVDYSKEGIMNGFETLLKHKEQWTKMGNRSKELYETKYSWKIMEERLIKAYQEL